MNTSGLILSKTMKKFKNASVLFLIIGSLFFSGYSSVKAEIKEDSKSENTSQINIAEVDPKLRAEAIKQGEDAREKIALLKKDSSLNTTAKIILDKADEANKQGNNELYLEKLREYNQIIDDEPIEKQIESKVLLAKVLFSQFQVKESERILEEVITLESNNPEHFLDYAQSLKWNGKYQEMKEASLQAISLIRDQKIVDEILLSRGLNSLGGAYFFSGQYELAIRPLEKALKLRKKLLGEEHLDVAVSLNELALLYSTQGRYNEAEPLYEQSLESLKKLLGEEHLDVATSLNNLAGIYSSQGRYSEAELLYKQSLELFQKLLGEEHSTSLTILNNIAVNYLAQGKYSEAELLYEQSLELRKKILGEEHPDVATSLNNLAVLYFRQGKYSEAKLIFEEALKILEARLGINHPNTNITRQSLQQTLDVMNKQP